MFLSTERKLKYVICCGGGVRFCVQILKATCLFRLRIRVLARSYLQSLPRYGRNLGHLIETVHFVGVFVKNGAKKPFSHVAEKKKELSSRT